MGYSSDIKENIEQAPPAVVNVVEVVEVERQLHQIDIGHDDLLETRNHTTDDAEPDISGPGAAEHHEGKKRKRSVEVKARTIKKRIYIKWTESDTKLVKKDFHSIITDRPAKTVQNETEVEAFVNIAKLSKVYPWKTVHIKVMNESEKWKKRSTYISLFTS